MDGKELRVTVTVTIATPDGSYTTQEHLTAPAEASREQIVENGVGIARKALWDAYDGAISAG